MEVTGAEVELSAVSRDGRRVMGSGPDRSIYVWETNTPDRPRLIARNAQPITDAAISPNGTFVATCGQMEELLLYDLDADRRIPIEEVAQRFFYSIAFSPDERQVAFGPHSSGGLYLFDTGGGQQIARLATPEYMYAVAFSPDGRWLAGGAHSGFIQIWELASHREVQRFRAHDNMVARVAFAPDGRWLATGAEDATVRLWEVATARQAATLAGYGGYGARGIAFSPDGRLLATAQHDGTVELWDLGGLTISAEEVLALVERESGLILDGTEAVVDPERLRSRIVFTTPQPNTP
jgi:dipeptidyl aminopeptidase/acylaminoacyl peptidase